MFVFVLLRNGLTDGRGAVVDRLSLATAKPLPIHLSGEWVGERVRRGAQVAMRLLIKSNKFPTRGCCLLLVWSHMEQIKPKLLDGNYTPLPYPYHIHLV